MSNGRKLWALAACTIWCAAAWSQSQAEMNQAAFEAYVAADDDLKSALAEYRARLTGDQLRLFDDSQRAWEQFRVAACAFQSSGAEGGSVQPLVHAQCMESFTRRRFEQVKLLANCNDEDLSCPASQSDI